MNMRYLLLLLLTSAPLLGSADTAETSSEGREDLSAGALAQEGRYTVDEILAVLYHPEGNGIVLLSDLTASLDGQEKSLKDVIIERLMVLDALKYKITITEEELDRFLAQLQKQNGWTRNDLILFLDEHGYSYDDGRELLREKQMVNQIIDYKVRSDKRMMISREDALAYYNEHPDITEATYTLDIAYVPFSQYDQKNIDTFLKSKKVPQDIVWDEPFVLKESELAEDRKFIAKEKTGTIVLVEKMEDGYELTRLVEKTEAVTIPFEDSYAKIVAQMRQEQFQHVLKDYHNELLAGAKIKFCREGLSL
jgi:hypothetical protein